MAGLELKQVDVETAPAASTDRLRIVGGNDLSLHVIDPHGNAKRIGSPAAIDLIVDGVVTSYGSAATTDTERGTALIAAATAAGSGDIVRIKSGVYNVGAAVIPSGKIISGDGPDSSIIQTTGTLYSQRACLKNLRNLTMRSADSIDIRLSADDIYRGNQSAVRPVRDHLAYWRENFDATADWAAVTIAGGSGAANVTISLDAVNSLSAVANNGSVRCTVTNNDFRGIRKTYGSAQDLRDPATGLPPVLAFRFYLHESSTQSAFNGVVVRIEDGSGNFWSFWVHNTGTGGLNQQTQSPGWIDYSIDMHWLITRNYCQAKSASAVNWANITRVWVMLSQKDQVSVNSVTFDRIIAIPRTAAKKGMMFCVDDGYASALPTLRKLNAYGIPCMIAPRINHMGLATDGGGTIFSVDELHQLQRAGNYICFQSTTVWAPETNVNTDQEIIDDVLMASRLAKEYGFNGWDCWVPQQGVINPKIFAAVRKQINFIRPVEFEPGEYNGPVNTLYDPYTIFAASGVSDFAQALTDVQAYGGFVCGFTHGPDDTSANNMISALAAGVEPLVPSQLPTWARGY